MPNQRENQYHVLCAQLGLTGGKAKAKFKCPSHDDGTASGVASLGNDGRILINCHAGCRTEDILAAWGFTMQDLFPPEQEKPKQKHSPIVATYPYLNEVGGLLYEKVRRADKSFSIRRPDGSGGWIWGRGNAPHVLYRLPEVLKEVGPVFILEGEKDADNLAKAGLTATTGENGAGPGKWLKEYTEQLRGKHCLVIGDHDDVGRAYAIETANALHSVAATVKLLVLSNVWPEIPEHGDYSDMLEALGEEEATDRLLTLMHGTPEWEPTTAPIVQLEVKQSEEWEEPIPFDTVNTPDFPTECLPAPLATFVEALAESTQTPTEMSAVLSIGVLATALQSKFDVEITPDWKEPLCLYTVAIADPGERKSAVLSALTKPIYSYEADRRAAEEVEIRQNQDERSLLEQRLEAAKKNAVKAKGENAFVAKQEVLELSAELAEFKEKHRFRLLVDDTTPEKLVEIMDSQNGCITVSSAEGGLFDSMSGRYDKSSNFDIYLKGHAGDPITVDRIGRKANHVKDPRLTMMLTIQPEVVTGLMENATFRGRGLCGRFLYAKCKSKVSRRNVNPPSIPYDVKSQYSLFVKDILSREYSGTIRLSEEAQVLRIQYAEAIEHRLGDTLEHMRDWGGKAVGAMLRIAALIHAAEVQVNPAEVNISAKTVAAAIKIMEALCVHAMAVYQDMGSDQSLEDAKYLLRRLESTGQDEISKRDLFDLCKGKFKKVEAMDSALQTLIDMGHIREVEKKTGGRPTRKLIVNPLRKSSKSSKRAS